MINYRKWAFFVCAPATTAAAVAAAAVAADTVVSAFAIGWRCWRWLLRRRLVLVGKTNEVDGDAISTVATIHANIFICMIIPNPIMPFAMGKS
jgi:hypothetical protein